MKKKFLRLDDNTKKSIIISLCILSIILLVILYIYQNRRDNYTSIKQDKNKYLVYEKTNIQDNDYPKYVPYINIKSTNIDIVNKDIDDITKKYLDSEKASITYEYDINGIILSVVIIILDDKIDYNPEILFRTYNINLDTLELISNESLLDFFKTNESEISKIIENQFKNYYEELVKQKYYVKEECNYDCFLRYKNVKRYTDNLNYYVKDGNLIAYKPFIFYSIFKDEEYFTMDKFEFLLVESKNVNLE